MPPGFYSSADRILTGRKNFSPEHTPGGIPRLKNFTSFFFVLCFFFYQVRSQGTVSTDRTLAKHPRSVQTVAWKGLLAQLSLIWL